jgi:predicted RNA-binding Zn ribbon-like protein
MRRAAQTAREPHALATLGIVGAGVVVKPRSRDSVRHPLRTDRRPPSTDAPHRAVTPLGEWLAAAPLVLTVAASDGSAALTPADPRPLLSRVAAAVADSLIAGTWMRLKACEAADCHWAYYDRSPAGRGRWCSMQVCGARAKMRRYRGKAAS